MSAHDQRINRKLVQMIQIYFISTAVEQFFAFVSRTKIPYTQWCSVDLIMFGFVFGAVSRLILF